MKVPGRTALAYQHVQTSREYEGREKGLYGLEVVSIPGQMVQRKGGRLLELRDPGLSQLSPCGSANHPDNCRAWGRKTEADGYQRQVPSCPVGRARPEELISWVELTRVALVFVASQRMEGIP